MRNVLAGLLMSGICLPSFGGQGNATLLNMGGQVGDTYYINYVAPGVVPVNKHLQVQDELLEHYRKEAKNREAELAAKTQLTVQQKRELDDLRAQLASIEQDYRWLQVKYDADVKKAMMLSNSTMPAPKTDGVAIAIPAAEREIFVLIERSEADRAGLSKSLDKAPDRLEPILKALIAKTASMDDKERTEWYAMLPRMTQVQRIRLFDILSTERLKLANLELKYQEEIANLNTKHLDEWIEFQRKHMDKNDPVAIRSFAATLIDSGQAKYLTEAEDLLLKLVRSHAGDAESHYQLGLLYATRKQWQDAKDSIAVAIRLAPDKADFHALLGKIFQFEVQNDKALEAYAQAFRLKTQDIPLLRSYGEMLLNLKRYTEAEAVLRRFLELAPKNAEAYRLLGVALSNQEHFAEAEGYLKQAVDRDGKNPQNHLSLAWAYYRHRQYAEAGSVFLIAANQNPEDVDATTMFGLSMAEQGRRKEALKALQAALKRALSHKASKADEAEIRLGAALLLSDDGKADEGKALLADAAANSQGCSIGYMKTRRNWHDQMLRLLGEWRGSLCGG